MIGIAPSKIVADLLERDRETETLPERNETAEKTAAFLHLMKETWVGLDGLDRLANSQVLINSNFLFPNPYPVISLASAFSQFPEGERTTMRSAVEEEESDQVSNHVMTRSAYNHKKFMDYYANRRMTHSLFKQQQEQKGDEKTQQQQQKKRKRKRKNKNKNKKKKPVVDDTPKISWRHMRYFTPEEREAYQKKLKESEGFDVGKYTSEVALSNPISEISLEEPSEVSDFSTEAAKMAIRDYNRKKRTKYECVKLVRVCIGLCTGWMYYITFQAKQDGMAPSPPRNFQARVHNFIGMHVQFCREEKNPQLTEGPGEPSQK